MIGSKTEAGPIGETDAKPGSPNAALFNLYFHLAYGSTKSHLKEVDVALGFAFSSLTSVGLGLFPK